MCSYVTHCKFAIVYTQVKYMFFTTWDSPFLNTILCPGNSFYTCISNAIKKYFLLVTDVPEFISVDDEVYYSDSFAHNVHM